MTHTPSPTLSDLWPTVVGVHEWSDAPANNETLVRVLNVLRAQDPHAVPGSAFYVSPDDLLNRIRIPEWQALIRFIVAGVSKTVGHANRTSWGSERPGFQLALRGLWCQMSNGGAHHDIHTHGNCSWSGVYCLQVDPEAQREAHPVFGARNGVTRLYGPYTALLGGAHSDFGNAYLQDSSRDIAPRAGQLVVFPSWLAHQALPYAGAQDRVIISFNVSVHAEGGDDQTRAYASA